MNKTRQSVEIELLEQLVSRDHHYLRHFALAYEKEAQRVGMPLAKELWKRIKHQKQKALHRQCVTYSESEVNQSLAKTWKNRADALYARGDFDGLVQLRRAIEDKSFPATCYAVLLQERHEQLQEEIAELREDTRRLRVSFIRERKTLSPFTLQRPGFAS